MRTEEERTEEERTEEVRTEEARTEEEVFTHQEEHALLKALLGQLVQTALPDELLQEQRNQHPPLLTNHH